MADLPGTGTGAGLADHPVTRLLLVPEPGSCSLNTPLAQVVLRYTAAGSDEFNDMQQVMFSHVALLTEQAMSSDDALAAYVRATVTTQPSRARTSTSPAS